MAIAFKGSGAGVATETSGAACSPASPATVDAGDILIIHAYFEGTATAPSTPSGFTLLDGPRVVETSIGRHWIYGKIAAGTEDGAANALGTAAVTTMRSGRCYSFSGRVAGTITDLVPAASFAATSHATDPQMPSVTATVAGALAVACVIQNDNNALAAATGESGGDWVEATAEFVAALTPGLVLQLQTAAMASPGTISGGSVAATNDPSGVIGFEIRPSLPAITGTGALAAQAADAGGAGTSTSTGTGALASQAATADGSGTSASTGTGALASQVASADGAGTSASTGTGALASSTADLVGEGEVTGESSITGTGALVAQAASTDGAGTSASSGSGTLAAQAAQADGSGTSASTGTGALSASGATSDGSGVSSSTGEGSLDAQSAELSGSEAAGHLPSAERLTRGTG